MTRTLAAAGGRHGSARNDRQTMRILTNASLVPLQKGRPVVQTLKYGSEQNRFKIMRTPPLPPLGLAHMTHLFRRSFDRKSSDAGPNNATRLRQIRSVC